MYFNEYSSYASMHAQSIVISAILLLSNIKRFLDLISENMNYLFCRKKKKTKTNADLCHLQNRKLNNTMDTYSCTILLFCICIHQHLSVFFLTKVIFVSRSAKEIDLCYSRQAWTVLNVNEIAKIINWKKIAAIICISRSFEKKMKKLICVFRFVGKSEEIIKSIKKLESNVSLFWIGR